MSEQKTHAEIIEEMNCGPIPEHRHDREILRLYAYELDAAHKREKAAIEADALAVGGIVEAAYKRERGNCAKLREALGKLRAELWNNTVIAGKRKFELYEIADAALAAPPRNCDVGTAEDQAKRLNEWCNGRHCINCRYKGGRLDECKLKWAQMPYDLMRDALKKND